MKLSEIIKNYRRENGISMDELANRSGLSKPYISMLEKNKNSRNGKPIIPSLRTIQKLAKGMNITLEKLLSKIDGKQELHIDTTDISISPRPSLKGVKIPILGRVVAGTPIEAITDIEGYEEITPKMAATGDFFALRVKGHSMEPYMLPDDIVIIRRQEDVECGDIAIVLVNGEEATVKKVQKTKEGITLIGMNPSVYPPHFYTNQQIFSLPVTVIGRVMEIRRSV